MPGLLSSLLPNFAGAGQATPGLGLDPRAMAIIGSHLMAAGAPSKDRGASMRILSGAAPSLMEAMRQAQIDEEQAKYHGLQMQQLQQQLSGTTPDMQYQKEKDVRAQERQDLLDVNRSDADVAQRVFESNKYWNAQKQHEKERAEDRSGLSPEALKQQLLLRSASNQPRTQQIRGGIPHMLANGKVVTTRFNADTGEYEYKDESGKWGPTPYDARPITIGTGAPLNQSDYIKTGLEYTDEVNALNKLNTYATNVGGLDVGLSRWADQVSANIKTLLGNPITAKELKTQVAGSQFQGLLGAFRTEVVGPGVMTEPDAARVVSALGGNVDALQNPEVVKEVLSSMYETKMKRAKIMQRALARSAPAYDDDPPTLEVPEALQMNIKGRGNGGGGQQQGSGGQRINNSAPKYKIEKVE